MKRLLALALMLLLILTTTACASGAATPEKQQDPGDTQELGEYTVRIAHGSTLDNPVHKGYVQMKEYVEKKTNGNKNMLHMVFL